MHKQALQEQRKFTQIANQVAHDIRSPLASLLMIVKSCSEIPEAERIALREAAISIGDIANNLLSQYTHKNTDLAPESQANQPMLVSATLMQLLTDKKYEYQNLPVKLTHEFSQKGHFAFIKISISDFKRMISNLINNAKEAFHFSNGKKAKISVNLDATNEWVTISIQDNGKGMSPELIRKIKQNIAVSEGKNAGYGIGLTQVRDTLRRHQGEICITSEVGQGTKILLTFPRFKAPNWIGEEIKLGKEDIIVILDDDASIHSAWDTKLDSLLKTTPSLQIKHFHQGREALNFLNSLAPEEKEKVFLLTDFELLKQELNGLTVIKKSGITRSLLVTSHYVKPFLRDQAARIGTKILPKQLASEINILIDSDIQYKNIEAKHIDLIIVDDDKRFSDSLTRRLFLDKKVDHYLDPYHFLKQVTRYPKNTKILLDNHFATNMTGIELAEKLHEIGYTSLYLLSGDTFKKSELPIYLTVIRKDDISSIKKLNNE
jgi:FixJ family two-component response regulator